MAKTSLEEIGRSLSALATPKMKPKELLEAVRKKHPKASRKDVVRAAFYSIIAGAADDPEKASTLHEFALTERGGPEDEAEER